MQLSFCRYSYNFFFNRCPLFFLIGVYLLYNVALVSAVQWSESTMCIHISPPSWTFLSHPTPSPALGHHRAWSWAPCAIEQLLTSCFTHGSVFISSVLISQFIPPSPSPSPPTPVSTCLLSASEYFNGEFGGAVEGSCKTLLGVDSWFLVPKRWDHREAWWWGWQEERCICVWAFR